MSDNTSARMPVLFVGHGSPDNALGGNAYSAGWEKAAAAMPRPAAILCMSAHWYADGVRFCSSKYPRQIFDMYGFPPELYNIEYRPDGDPKLAVKAMELAGKGAALDDGWGLDHGAWAVLCRMYPEADIPVVQVSVDKAADAKACFDLGARLAPLRREGVLLMGSGNVVHDLGRVDWGMDGGYDWASEFDGWVKENTLAGRGEQITAGYRGAPHCKKAVPTPEHFLPFAFALGAASAGAVAGAAAGVTAFNEGCTLGSISMTSYIFA